MKLIKRFFYVDDIFLIPTVSLFFDKNFYFAKYKRCFSITFYFLKFYFEISILYKKEKED